MKISNFNFKPLFKTVFFVAVLFSIANILIVFTNMMVFSKLGHLVIASTFALVALGSFLQNVFVKYDSTDELIEIERASLFTPRRKVKSSQQGYVKRQIRNYKVRSFLFFKSIELTYVKSNGDEQKYFIPVTLLGKESLQKIISDLKEILNNNSQMFIGSSFRNPYV